MKKSTRSLLALVALFALTYWRMFAPASFSQTPSAPFRVQQGESVQSVANRLQGEGLIRSESGLAFLMKLRGLTAAVQPGKYAISPSMSAWDVSNILTDVANSQVRVTIPEGFTVWDIDARLTDLGLIQSGDFVSVASETDSEGYLFPDTYFVFKHSFEPKDFIEKMKNTFLKKVTPSLDAIKAQHRTLKEVVTMASILEREVRTPQDLPIVAGILWKRLDHEWPLQADSTSLYGKSVTSISSHDLKEDTPYNTRINRGLPPTPIGNPGMAAIQAAISPESSPYWFYLTDKEGVVHYAKTNEEQNANRLRYIGN